MDNDYPVFRSTVARVLGWLWLVFAAANLVDLVVRGQDLVSVIAATVLFVVTGVVYITCLRPAIATTEDGVVVRNPLRDVWVPWAAIEKVDVTDAVRVHAGGRRYRAWVLQTSPRARDRAHRKVQRERMPGVPDQVAEQVAGRTQADYAAERVTELAGSHREEGSPREATVTWSAPAIAAVAVPTGLFGAALLVALIT